MLSHFFWAKKDPTKMREGCVQFDLGGITIASCYVRLLLHFRKHHWGNNIHILQFRLYSHLTSATVPTATSALVYK